MALKDIIGQKQALETLRGCISKNRIAHAYLFTGEDSVGKKLTAINFAKTLNCQNNRSLNHGIDCCDECPSCLKINRAVHPDVFQIAPEDGLIKVNLIRKLAESLSYKAFEGKWKIAIIDEADAFNQSAANAFLKTLEEPPRQSLLVLVSSMPELIPSTILSRCHRVNFSPLPLEDMRELIRHKYSMEGIKLQDKQAVLLGLLSGGKPGLALNKDLIKKRDKFFNQFKNLLGNITEDLWGDRDTMQDWYHWVQLWLRDIAVFRATGETSLLINQDKEQEIINISRRAELKDILKLYNTFYNIKDSLRFNLNKQLTLHYTYLLLKKTFSWEGRDA